ncbi:MAG: (d)CMP kinase [Verrucomicrobium sp.]|jgi:cytidylate kinase|nr:(d)CMP kinase [Verrucomicrobium sp.]
MKSRTLQLPQVIAVDGPSASGKGTLSRRLARELGYLYVDSGAMYRTLAWHCLRRGIRVEKPMTEADEKAVVRQLRSWKWEIRVVDGQAWIHVDGYFPGTEIRTDPVEKAVPVVAQIGKVRDWMVTRQRQCAALGPLVMEGRDIGTEVFPLAPVKFFLEADAAERQRRIADRGGSTDGAWRDSMDIHRKKGALIPALDSIRIDNTGQTPDETFAVLMGHVRTRLGPKASRDAGD